MDHALFITLLDGDVPRGHPSMTGLLYAYCPAAARWWLSGVEPVLPFEPVWAAIEMRSTGKTLREVLEAWGLSGLLDTARSYVDRVEDYRSNELRKHLRSPELFPEFRGDQIPFEKRYRSSKALDAIGGWKNFLPFVRAWAFAIEDWRQSLKLDEVNLENHWIPVRMNGSSQVHIPIWSISDRKREYRFFVVEDCMQKRDLFPVECFHHGMNLEDAGDLYLFDGFGRTERLRSSLRRSDGTLLLKKLTLLGSIGPYPPFVGLKDPDRCRGCGFQAVCWEDAARSSLSSLALDFSVNDDGA